MFGKDLVMSKEITFKRLKMKNLKEGKVHNCQSFKKLSQQVPDSRGRVFTTLFLGNRYDRRRVTFIFSLLFDDIENKPVLYDMDGKGVLSPKKVVRIWYDAIKKDYHIDIRCAVYNYTYMIIAEEVWNDMIHLEPKFAALDFELDELGNNHLIKRHVGGACLNGI